MNRTGLVIALGLSLVIGLLFGIFPELDLKLAALFFDPTSASFPLKQHGLAAFARDGAMWIAWALALPALFAIVAKLVRPDRPMLVPGRAAVFLLVTILLSAVVLTNLTFKSYWGRPRPVMVTEFNGPWQFVPWWDPRGECGRNCSFFSGEGATAFWTYAPAALTPPAWRPLAYVAATVFGVVTSGLRMAFGGHFFTDVAPARQLLRDLAGLCLDLPLAVDEAFGCAGRSHAGAMGLARIPPVAAPARARGGAIRSGRRAPLNACPSARKRYNDIRHFDRLEAP
jgi:membrane-associated PAP2 superfamily phosphatase